MKKYGVVFAVVVVALGLSLAYYGRPVRESASTVTAAQPAGHDAAGGQTGKVIETMDAGGYTYVQIETADGNIWAAGPETKIAVGEVVTIPPGMEMEDFKSATLDRKFDKVLFVSQIVPAGGGEAAMPMAHPRTGASAADLENMDFAGIEVPEGGKSIAALYSEKASLAGTRVVVRGRVVKYTPGVMDKNWLHIRDGSGAEGTNDLTVTTDTEVKVGDLVVAEGVITVGRDFGMGYTYEILMENAVVTVE